MYTLSKNSRIFLAAYKKAYPRFEKAAREAQELVKRALRDSVIPIHMIEARAKSVDSLRGKLRRKRYRHPARQVTDLVALRVITYFWQDVDRAAVELRSWLEISSRKSRDARVELATNKFGYRSLNLIVRLQPGQAANPNYKTLRRRWFEIQIRSILDHAWSEIEHEVIYKAGIDYPIEVRRRFTAVAGALEVLEHAFAGLTIERHRLIDKYKIEYAAGLAGDKKFDVARLLGFLESVFPSGLSWREAEKKGEPFAAGLAVAAVGALQLAQLNNADRLHPIIRSARFRRFVKKFAALEGLAPEAVSHLALLVITIAVAQPRILEEQFPEMLFAPSLSWILESTKE